MLAILLIYIGLTMQDDLLEFSRVKFKQALQNEQEAIGLDNKLRDITVQQPLLYAYKGSTKVILANHTIWPYKKLSLVKEGLSIINSAVDAKKTDAEIRLLRFNIEDHIPDFLGLKTHVQEDYIFLKTFIEKSHTDLNKDIYNALINAKHLDANQKKNIKNHI